MDQAKPRLRAVADASIDEHADTGDIVAALVERAQRGDMAAWSRLYHDHFSGLYRHLRYLTGEVQVAEDLVQETFVQALKGIGGFDGRAKFVTWLHGIGLNLARRHWRSERTKAASQGRLKSVESDRRESSSGGEPDGATLTKQRVNALYVALAQLPPHLSEAFILRELEQLPLEEAAAQAGVSPNNLAVRTNRAKARLRHQLAQWESKR